MNLICEEGFFWPPREFSSNAGLHLHSSLQDDPIHLLTDDRFGKVNDFITIALEKDNLKKVGNRLVKDHATFTSAYDFHRARIDNPIDVMRQCRGAPHAAAANRAATRLYNRVSGSEERLPNTSWSRLLPNTKRIITNITCRENPSPWKSACRLSSKENLKNVGVLLSHGYMAAPLEVKESGDIIWGAWVFGSMFPA